MSRPQALALARPRRRGVGSVFLAIHPWPPPPSAARSVRCSCTSIPAAAKPGQSPASRFTSAAGVGRCRSHGSCPCSPPSRWPASCRRRGWAPSRCSEAAPAASWRGPAGPRFPWTFAWAPQPLSGRCRDRRSRSSQRGGRGTGSAVAVIAPVGGAGTLPFPVSLWPPLSPLALSSSRLGWISAGCGSGCSIAQPPPPPAAAWWLAARRCRGRGSCRPPMVPGRSGGCEPESRRLRRQSLQPNSPEAPKPNSQGKTKQPEGKGPEGSRTKKGAWGEETAGANAAVGDDAGRVAAVPVGGAAAVRDVEPGATAQQLPLLLG